MEKEFDSIKNFEIIQRYFDSDFSHEEKIEFEKQLELDEELKAEFNLYKALIDGVIQHSSDEFKQQFKEIDKRLDQLENKKTSRFQKWIGYAASIIIIIGVSQYLFMPKTSNSLVAKYWEEDRGTPNFMGVASSSTFSKFMEFYKMEQYDSAYKIIPSIVNQSDTLNYYAGIVEYKRDEIDRAIVYFQKVIHSQESVYFEKAEFRLSLCLLKVKKNNEAKKIVKKIAQSQDHLYNEIAKELLKEL